jgi:hypothetical protein
VRSSLFAPLTHAAVLSTLGPLRFEVSLQPDLTNGPNQGRLFIILSQSNAPEPRLALGRTGRDAPQALASDVSGLTPGVPIILDQAAFAFPITNLANLASGDYYVQALFAANPDLRLPNAPGNLHSRPRQLALESARSSTIRLELTEKLPAEKLPPETDQIKFIKLESKLLSDFFHRPIFLRAGVVLPRDYQREPTRRYPLWVRVGGFGGRYTGVSRLLSGLGEFRSTWQADDTPRFLLLQLDGAGPFGDPYYVNSANNGPYGDAVVQELIPYVEEEFRGIRQPRARFLSGTSTGGWVSLALQIFYPDFFNGTWSSCPDPVDFRAFELVNIYQDQNAYTDKEGKEIPSERNLKGAVVLTMRQEVGAENLLGTGNSYTMSGGQWGSWNAVYSPRAADGLPAPLWDAQTGRLDHSIADQWKKYDLRLMLEHNWKTLGPKLRGKIHIASGEADQYYLNNAVHLLDDSLSHAHPPFEGSIVFGPGKGHGWSNLSLKEMLKQMNARLKTE